MPKGEEVRGRKQLSGQWKYLNSLAVDEEYSVWIKSRSRAYEDKWNLTHNVIAVISNPILENRLMTVSELFLTRPFLGAMWKMEYSKTEAVSDF